MDDIPANLLIAHRSAFYAEYHQARNIPVPMEHFTLRPWQQRLVDILALPIDKRKIYWYWERTGNVGKSWMATFLLRNHGATVLSTGKTADIAYLLDKPTCVVFDISRAQGMEHVNFSVMEDIKNGRIFSPKYNSVVKYFDVPNIIVFANEPCPNGKFSLDRLDEYEIPQEIQVPTSIFTVPPASPPYDTGSYVSGFTPFNIEDYIRTDI